LRCLLFAMRVSRLFGIQSHLFVFGVCVICYWLHSEILSGLTEDWM